MRANLAVCERLGLMNPPWLVCARGSVNPELPVGEILSHRFERPWHLVVVKDQFDARLQGEAGYILASLVHIAAPLGATLFSFSRLCARFVWARLLSSSFHPTLSTAWGRAGIAFLVPSSSAQLMLFRANAEWSPALSTADECDFSSPRCE